MKESNAVTAALNAPKGFADALRSHTNNGGTMSKVNVGWVTITPERATELLQNNDHNRPLRNYTVMRYAKEMEDGMWRETGDPVRLASDGSVLDGQHRLWACVTSGCDFRTLLITGLDPELFPMIDRGARRSGGDNLAIVGEKDTNNLSAALSHQWRYDRGWFDKFTQPQYRPEPHAILDVLDEHPGMRDAVSTGRTISDLMPVSLAAFFAYQFERIDADHAREWFDKLATGVGFRKNDPLHRLRERLLRNRLEKTNLPIREIAALAIKAWNYSLEGRDVRALVWRSTSGEPFPEILDPNDAREAA